MNRLTAIIIKGNYPDHILISGCGMYILDSRHNYLLLSLPDGSENAEERLHKVANEVCENEIK